MRLIDYFDRGADLYPDRHCPHDGTQGWTYREVRAQTHRVANGLLAVMELGVTRIGATQTAVILDDFRARKAESAQARPAAAG